jgi:2-keto-4-pentenoate hydratase
MPPDRTDLAAELHAAYDDAEPIAPESLPPDLSVDDAYEVQRAVADRRTGTEGGVVGYKIGFTSEAVRSDLGVSSPAYGRVLGDTVRFDGRFETADLIAPKVEPEIAFVLGRSLEPPVNRLDVAAATRVAVPVVEVVDSRVRDWEIEPAAAIADNALAARLVVGDPVPIGGSDLSLEGVELRIDGERRATGTGAAVLGHPADAVAWLAAALDERGGRLDAGDVVTTGSITEPIPVAAGETVVARFSSLGTVTAHAA